MPNAIWRPDNPYTQEQWNQAWYRKPDAMSSLDYAQSLYDRGLNWFAGPGGDYGVENGRVVPTDSWVNKYGPYIGAAMAGGGTAAGLALGAGAAAGAGGAAAAGGSASPGIAALGSQGIPMAGSAAPAVAAPTIGGTVGDAFANAGWTGALPHVGGGTMSSIGSAFTLPNLINSLPQLLPMIGSLFGGGMSDEEQANQRSINQLLDYQKRLLAMTDPSAAAGLGIAVPQGAVPMRQAALQAAYSMMPLFARQAAGQPQQTAGPAPTEPSRRPKVIKF